MTLTPILYDYWRSSAAYRVRIALHLLGRPFERRAIDLSSGAQKDPRYLAVNKQGLVPTLEVDGQQIGQSLAIVEYLHGTTPGSTLLPADPLAQARVRQLCYAIAMEIHPICNLSVARHVTGLVGQGEETMQDWMTYFIAKGLAAFEAMLDDDGPFCHGTNPGMADCCLIPQLHNADRFGVSYANHPNICRVADAAADHPAFDAAHPRHVKVSD